jgi:hypothetical protein
MGLLTTASRPRSDSRGRPASLPKAASRSWVFAFLRGGSTESDSGACGLFPVKRSQPQANSTAPAGVKRTKVPLSCGSSQPLSIARRSPALVFHRRTPELIQEGLVVLLI